MHACINTYIHTYVRTYLRTYVSTYLRTYVSTYLRTYLRTYVPTYLRTYVPTYLRTYVPTYVLIHLHIYILIPLGERRRRLGASNAFDELSAPDLEGLRPGSLRSDFNLLDVRIYTLCIRVLTCDTDGQTYASPPKQTCDLRYDQIAKCG